ncbi:MULTISPECIES: hypothetical protein [Gilliamella]|uniref:hypothetical protein n=1 Tax=Gilliamella TaxID=1193503 RepID=UPI0016429AB2|nr:MULTISPECIES: hypothetical protein [Gilliamella]MBI0095009.1 hypothetical protein [Gilliamella sp. W8136]
MANISLDAVLMCECNEDTKLSNELRSYVLWAISDLITDSKKLFSSETESKRQKNENK